MEGGDLGVWGLFLLTGVWVRRAVGFVLGVSVVWRTEA